MPPRPLMLGHRGLRAVRAQLLTKLLRRLPPENSIEAFEFALQQGAHGFEFDVRRTADGRGVICHDPVIEHKRVADCTLADLRSVVPYLASLEEVLARFAKRAFLDIELKVRGLEYLTLELAAQHCSTSEFVISSFLPEVLETVAELDSQAPLGYIFNLQENANRWRSLPVNYLFPSQPLTDKRLIDAAHDASKLLVPWTINSPRQIRHFLKCGVDGLISDDPAVMVRTLATMQEEQGQLA